MWGPDRLNLWIPSVGQRPRRFSRSAMHAAAAYLITRRSAWFCDTTLGGVSPAGLAGQRELAELPGTEAPADEDGAHEEEEPGVRRQPDRTICEPELAKADGALRD